MTTNTNIDRRAMMAGNTAASQPSTPYRGAGERRVVCPGTSALNTGGRLIAGHSFRPEGAWRKDRRQLQN